MNPLGEPNIPQLKNNQLRRNTRRSFEDNIRRMKIDKGLPVIPVELIKDLRKVEDEINNYKL